ncbi:hypothetical protein Hanom_Chr05g00439241 [Helianthus anomalus]
MMTVCKNNNKCLLINKYLKKQTNKQYITQPNCLLWKSNQQPRCLGFQQNQTQKHNSFCFIPCLPGSTNN